MIEVFVVLCLSICAGITWIILKPIGIVGNVPIVRWKLPIFGHMLFLGAHPAAKFLQWKKIYGPIFQVYFGSYPTIILNDLKLIKEVFGLQSVAGRPMLPNFIEMSHRKGVVLNDGPRQREQRNFIVKSLREFGVGKPKLEYLIQDEINTFIQNLRLRHNISKEGKVVQINHLFEFPVINSLWMVISGKRFEENDPTLGRLAKLMDDVLDTNSSLVAKTTWFFPWCSKLLSFIGRNPCVRAWCSFQKYFADEIEQTKYNHVPGDPKHFTHDYFDQVNKATDTSSSFHISRQEQVATTTDIFAAAVDSTTVSMDWLIFYMALEQEVQRKLQQEIHDIVGPKLKTEGNASTSFLIHRAQMPYTQAVIQELFRLTTVTPLAIFHRATEDTLCQGYNIPKDTMVMANLYAAHHDSEVWSEPDKFCPERFLDQNGKLNTLLEIIPFSYGKRSCLGESFARNQIFCSTVNFFQAFHVSFPDKNNPPKVKENFRFISFPDPFQVCISEIEN